MRSLLHLRRKVCVHAALLRSVRFPRVLFSTSYSRSLPFRLLIIPGDKLQNRLAFAALISSRPHFFAFSSSP